MISPNLQDHSGEILQPHKRDAAGNMISRRDEKYVNRIKQRSE